MSEIRQRHKKTEPKESAKPKDEEDDKKLQGLHFNHHK